MTSTAFDGLASKPSLAPAERASAGRSVGGAPTGKPRRRLASIALIALALAYVLVALAIPLVAVFVEALRKGVAHYWTSIADPEALAAIRLTFVAAAIAVPANLVFGVTAAWAIAKFDFRGKAVLITLIDLPFSVSPVVSGLCYVLLFGLQGWLGRGSRTTT